MPNTPGGKLSLDEIREILLPDLSKEEHEVIELRSMAGKILQFNVKLPDLTASGGLCEPITTQYDITDVRFSTAQGDTYPK